MTMITFKNASFQYEESIRYPLLRRDIYGIKNEACFSGSNSAPIVMITHNINVKVISMSVRWEYVVNL